MFAIASFYINVSWSVGVERRSRYCQHEGDSLLVLDLDWPTGDTNAGISDRNLLR
jgi:hypothetical protein